MKTRVVNKTAFDLVKSQFKLKKINKIRKPRLGQIQLPSPDRIAFNPDQLMAAIKVAKPTTID
ncbi:hypothetical protein GTO36_08250 [bacterium]|nr:hypothetical protein [bacterium]